MAALEELQTQIAELETRAVELDKNVVRPDRTFDGGVMSAQNVVSKKLAALHRRREALLAGDPDPAEPTKLVEPSPPAWMPSPRFVTSKQNRESAENTLAKFYKNAVKELPPDTSSEDIHKRYHEAMFPELARTEARLREIVELHTKNRVCAFSEGLYLGFLMAIVELDVRMAATFHQAGNQRRLLEKRVADIEQRVADVVGRTGHARELAELQERVRQLEARPVLKFSGVWHQREYDLGEIVTHDGSWWHCNAKTRGKPGASSDWTLGVKRGRDGKDLRS